VTYSRRAIYTLAYSRRAIYTLAYCGRAIHTLAAASAGQRGAGGAVRGWGGGDQAEWLSVLFRVSGFGFRVSGLGFRVEV
jgi:hypothetical protein